jgi:nucleotide-binding universal stress UspA family protein
MRVLVAVEKMNSGKIIFEFIKNHSWPEGSEFWVIHAIEPTEAILAWPSERLRADSERLLADFVRMIRHAFPGMKARKEIRHGSAKGEIIKVAEDWGADVIILGSHTREDLAHYLPGSVSTAVALHAPCSVAIVKMSGNQPSLNQGEAA